MPLPPESHLSLLKGVGAGGGRASLLVFVVSDHENGSDWEWFEIPRDPVVLEIGRLMCTEAPTISIDFMGAEDDYIHRTQIPGGLMSGLTSLHCAVVEPLVELNGKVTVSSTCEDAEACVYYEGPAGKQWLMMSSGYSRGSDDFAVLTDASRSVYVQNAACGALVSPGFVSTGAKFVDRYSVPVCVKIAREDLRRVVSMGLSVSPGMRVPTREITASSRFKDPAADSIRWVDPESPGEASQRAASSRQGSGRGPSGAVIEKPASGFSSWSRKDIPVSIGDSKTSVGFLLGTPDTVYLKKAALGRGEHWIYRPDLVVTFDHTSKAVANIRVTTNF